MWTKDFQNNIKKEMLKSHNEQEFCKWYGRYIISAKSYEQVYEFVIIIYHLITKNRLIFDSIFIRFYELVFWTNKASFSGFMEKYSYISLIEYYRKKDNCKFNELIEKSREFLSKDLTHYIDYKEKMKSFIYTNYINYK